jgi:hypothetical protein
MASLEEAAYKKLSNSLADTRMSPAILAMKMSKENAQVADGMLSLFVNYIIIMANKHTVPFQLKEAQDICKLLLMSLEELGLTGTVQQANEYLAV